MDYALTDDQMELIADFRAFGDQWLDADKVRQWQRDQGIPDEVALAFVEAYYRHDELFADTSQGGSLLAQTLVSEELARSSGAMLPFADDIMHLKFIEEFADPERFAPLLDEYRQKGRLGFALAISEPEAGSDTMNMKTCVKRRGNSLFMKGRKTFVANGEYAPGIVVAAIDSDKSSHGRPELSFWLLPHRLDGISVHPINKIGQHMLPFADVVLDNVEIEPAYRLSSHERAGFPQLFHLLEIGRIMVCAQSLGMARAAMEDATAYAAHRTAFDHPICDFQQIQQMIVDMEIKISNMRDMVRKAAWKFDQDAPDKRLAVALMKRYVPAAATEVASDAMQILGGRGYTENERVSWIWQDCRGNQISEGTDQIMTRIAAPLVMKSYEA